MFKITKKELPAIEPGTPVIFTRFSKVITGIVEVVRENTVIVELSAEHQEFLALENEYTVVNHKNYKVSVS